MTKNVNPYDSFENSYQNSHSISPSIGRINISSTTAEGESCEAIYTASAISCTFINRDSGKVVPSHDPERVAPGNTAVTFILYGFSSSRKTLVMPNTAYFEIQYEPPLVYGLMLATEQMLKICPLFSAIISGKNNLLV